MGDTADAEGERRGAGGDLGGDEDVHLEQTGEAGSKCRDHVAGLSTDGDGDREYGQPQRNCGRGLAVDEQRAGGALAGGPKGQDGAACGGVGRRVERAVLVDGQRLSGSGAALNEDTGLSGKHLDAGLDAAAVEANGHVRRLTVDG